MQLTDSVADPIIAAMAARIMFGYGCQALRRQQTRHVIVLRLLLLAYVVMAAIALPHIHTSNGKATSVGTRRKCSQLWGLWRRMDTELHCDFGPLKRKSHSGGVSSGFFFLVFPLSDPTMQFVSCTPWQY